MNTEEKMRMTLDLARKAMEEGELPIAAIVFHKDEKVGSACTSEVKDRRLLVHAELKALLEADKKCDSVLLRKEIQLFTNLEPCLMCLGAAMTFYAGEIHYALEAPMDGAVDFVQKEWNKLCEEIPSYTVPKIFKGTLREKSIQLFKEYIETHKPGPMYDFAKSLACL